MTHDPTPDPRDVIVEGIKYDIGPDEDPSYIARRALDALEAAGYRVVRQRDVLGRRTRKSRVTPPLPSPEDQSP